MKNIVEAETEAEQNRAFDVLGEIVTNVQFANDEGDPGMGLELGLDLLCYGGERLHRSMLSYRLRVLRLQMSRLRYNAMLSYIALKSCH